MYFQVEDRLGEIKVSADGVAGIAGSLVEFLAREFSRQSRKRWHVLQ
jgi:hypothetical protein